MASETILIADDDHAIRTVLNQALSRAGYEVRATSNAATLWKWVSDGEGDLVITDVLMPDDTLVHVKMNTLESHPLICEMPARFRTCDASLHQPSSQCWDRLQASCCCGPTTSEGSTCP